MNFSGYHGNGGDGLQDINGTSFSTPDRDIDDSYSLNCASDSGYGGGSGFWFKACLMVNLNGLNHGHAKKSHVSMSWYYWGDKHESLKTITMAIRRADIPGDK